MKRWYLVSALILLALLGSLATAGPLFIRVDQPPSSSTPRLSDPQARPSSLRLVLPPFDQSVDA